jgi:hypothetical protein
MEGAGMFSSIPNPSGFIRKIFKAKERDHLNVSDHYE